MAKQKGQPHQIKWNSPRQLNAFQVAQNPKYKYHLYRGGGGSGKSFLIMFIMICRALAARNSRHIIFRWHLTDCRQTLFDKTFREVMEAAWPGRLKHMEDTNRINQTEMSVEFDNGSMIFFDGLADRKRWTKVLGDEYNTAWFNECNEFDYEACDLVMGRCRLPRTDMLTGQELKNKAFFDCNPRWKEDFDYKAFKLKINPEDETPWENPDEWVEMKLYPRENAANLSKDALDLGKTKTAAWRLRYEEGEWGSMNKQALFHPDWVNKRRVDMPDLQDIKRIVVAVDPAISSNEKSDETGIIVAAVGYDGHAYILGDRTATRARPEEWAQVVAKAYQDYDADRVVAEKNQGGQMVETTLRTANRNLPIRLVHATRGKEIRAEPVSALYEQGKVHHVNDEDNPQHLARLEKQMYEFNPQNKNAKSPDRMDAMVWALFDLMDLKGSGPVPVKTRVTQRLR